MATSRTWCPLTVQHVFRAHQMDKIEMLARILQANGRGLSMVFCRTKRSADQVAEALTTRGFAAAAVHGDLGQGQRERAMRAFRNGKIDVLVATDVASRGLDVDDVTHVINYECPEDDKAYLHRTGRTGRAGRDGIAVTFVDWRDMPRWKLINEALGMGIPEPPETYSTSEHLFDALDIPAGVTGQPAPRRAGPGRPRGGRTRGRGRDREGPLAAAARPPQRPGIPHRSGAPHRSAAQDPRPQAHPGRRDGARRRAGPAGPGARGQGSGIRGGEPAPPPAAPVGPRPERHHGQLADFMVASRNRQGSVRRSRSVPG